MSRTSLKVELLSHTPHPDEVVATGARMCYSSAGVEDLIRGVAEKDQSKYLQRIVDMGHLSPIEHASFTFAVFPRPTKRAAFRISCRPLSRRWGRKP